VPELARSVSTTETTACGPRADRLRSGPRRRRCTTWIREARRAARRARGASSISPTRWAPRSCACSQRVREGRARDQMLAHSPARCHELATTRGQGVEVIIRVARRLHRLALVARAAPARRLTERGAAVGRSSHLRVGQGTAGGHGAAAGTLHPPHPSQRFVAGRQRPRLRPHGTVTCP